MTPGLLMRFHTKHPFLASELTSMCRTVLSFHYYISPSFLPYFLFFKSPQDFQSFTIKSPFVALATSLVGVSLFCGCEVLLEWSGQGRTGCADEVDCLLCHAFCSPSDFFFLHSFCSDGSYPEVSEPACHASRSLLALNAIKWELLRL